MFYALYLIFLISCLLLLIKQQTINFLFMKFWGDRPKYLAKQDFYINLYSALPKEYSFVTQIRSTDLEDHFTDLKLEDNKELNKMLNDNNTGLVVFNNSLSMACLIKFEQTDINILREGSLQDATKDLNIPCFVFKDSTDYDFKEVLSFLESQNMCGSQLNYEKAL